MTTLYGSNVLDSTLTTACVASTTTGGTEVNATTTIASTSNTYAIVLPRGGTGTSYASAPAATGLGWVWWCGAGTFATGNWSGSITHASAVKGVSTILRFYKISGGVYTAIGTITSTNTATTKTTYSYSATSFSGFTTGSGDGIYYELLWFDNNSNVGGDNPIIYSSSSATAGVANDAQITTATFTPGGTVTNKDTEWRANISQTGAKNTTFRGVLSTTGVHSTSYRGNIGHTGIKDSVWRAVLSAIGAHGTVWRGPLSQGTSKNTVWRGNTALVVAKNTTFRGVLSTKGIHDTAWRGKFARLGTHDSTWRINISAWILSGQFGVFANGSGAANFTNFRATQYPDPGLSLAPITPRVGTTLVSWNDVIPTNTTSNKDISTDGFTWTDVSSQNGGPLPGIYSQPDPTVDGFSSNTSANYTNTFRTGGASGAWTFNTANSRLIATGGTNALLVYNAINRADIDMFADLDQADAGGLVWRYIDQGNFYYLLVNDSLSSTGTFNTITLYKVASNVRTQLGTAAITYQVGPANNLTTVTFTRGTYRRFRVSMLGGVITVYVDGIQLFTYTDGSPLGAGLMGLYNNGGAMGSRYYQLSMQPLGDVVTGSPAGDIVTGTFVYTRQRLATTDPTVSAQVEDVTTMATTPQIGAGVSIPSVAYNATFLSKNFDDLAKQSNYYWFIDAAKYFNFRLLTAQPAPWILQSAPNGLVQNVDLEVTSNLELDVANDLYRNRMTILGAQDTLTANATFIGDGSTRSFTLGYPLASAPQLYLNGVTQSVGLKGATGFQWYYAINDPTLEQDASGVVLQDTDQLSVPGYSGLFDVTVVVDSASAQAAQKAVEVSTSGIVEAVEDHSSDSPRMSKSAAITLATQLIARYAIAGRTLIFDTTRNGLAVGMTLSIFLPEHGIVDGQFLITEIEITLQKGIGDTQVWWYKVTASELPKQASWAKIIAAGLGLQ